MIEGITILHQYETGHPDKGLQIFLCIIAILLLSVAVWNVIRKIRHQNEILSTENMIFSIVFAAVLFSINLWIGSWTPHTEYKVTIDDSVSYIEFTENYKVVDKEGSIYTIYEIGE